jgi:hypothetical protein
MAASYRLLCPHYINGIMLVADDIVTEGVDVPNGWVPTLACDPLNSDAVNAYYAAGPRSLAYEANPTFGGAIWGTWRNGAIPPAPATTHWVPFGGNLLWKLTGLGANKPAIGFVT